MWVRTPLSLKGYSRFYTHTHMLALCSNTAYAGSVSAEVYEVHCFNNVRAVSRECGAIIVCECSVWLSRPRINYITTMECFLVGKRYFHMSGGFAKVQGSSAQDSKQTKQSHNVFMRFTKATHFKLGPNLLSFCISNNCMQIIVGLLII